MVSSIIIDHPECLTSEDTASGSGASNDRTPKFYGFLDYNLDPVSENYYEYLAFSDVKYTEGLKDYLKYMSDVFYIDDGNEILYAKGFVEQGRNTSENEQPLYIFPFEKQFGPKNELSQTIISRATNMNSTGLFKFNESTNIAEIENTNFMKEEDPLKPDTVKILALIYKLLSEGKNVLYKSNGAERYEEFKLYKMIARSVHNHIPHKQLDRKEFSKYSVKKIFQISIVSLVFLLPRTDSGPESLKSELDDQ
jgi:hypothetical protein